MARLGLLAVLASSACGFDHGVVSMQDASVLSDAVDAPAPDPDGLPGCAALEIAASGTHTCARTNDGSVYCWGSGNNGELGVLPLQNDCLVGTTRYYCSTTPRRVELIGATALGLGSVNTCAATTGGTYCWGSNKYGSFGNGGSVASNIPQLVTQRAGATALIGGIYHTCSATGGNVSCAGQNVAGEVGNNTMLTQLTATQVLTGAASLGSGEYTSCAIDSSGLVHCWGYNHFGMIDSSGQNRLVPTLVPGIAGAVQVAPGRDHMCVLGSDHVATCWGNNAAGQVSTGQFQSIDAISANHNHTCILDTMGNVSCFGEGYGSTPVMIGTTRPATAIASGSSHDCAIYDDHTVWCWGNEHFGQLGNGSASQARDVTPVQAKICP